MKGSKEWATFLRIPEPRTQDQAPSLDLEWCVSHGVHPGAEVVLRLLRDKIIPLVQQLNPDKYHFLIHDRESGVPTVESDKSPYIHLQMTFQRAPSALKLPKCFVMTRPVSRVPDDKMLWMLEKQSDLALELIDALSPWDDDAKAILEVRKYLHYFANMFQMKVVG